ncbi:hypothetical protein AOLI_G00112540 [Acnodon oligacanthus]
MDQLKQSTLDLQETTPAAKAQHKRDCSSVEVSSAGEKGYCLKFWYHMFGATIGSLKLFLQNIDSRKTTLIWQRVGSQRNEWQLVQSHVTLQEVHQILIDASIRGEAGDIAIDDLWFAEGACSPTGGLCDFEEGSCGWTQQADDNLDWIRGSGNDPVLNSKPSFDHTTNTESGYYYYIASDSPHDMDSVFICGITSGQEPGTLKVFQEHSSEDRSLLLSQSGEQGKLWRFAQAPLLNIWSDYRDRAWQWEQSWAADVDRVRRSGNVWWRGRIYIHHREPFWFTLEYQKGEGSIGNVAIDDLHITSGSCDPATQPPPTAAPSDAVGIGVGVTLMILVVLIACIAFYVLWRRQSNRESIIENDMLERNAGYDLYNCEIQDSQS